MHVQSRCESAITLSNLPAPKLPLNFQGLFVGKEPRGVLLSFVCYIGFPPAFSVYP